MLDNLKINKKTDMKTINPINPRRYRPLSGSFANAWTLSIIPDLTINAPNKLSENTKIDNKIVQILSCDDFIDTPRHKLEVDYHEFAAHLKKEIQV